MRKRADTLKEFLENKESYIITTKDYVVIHDDKVADLFIIRTSPFSNEPQLPSELRERVQISLGVELLRGVSIYPGRYFRLKNNGSLFAHYSTGDKDDKKKYTDLLLEVSLTDTNRSMASDLFDLLKEWHRPVLYKKEVSFIKMIIRRSTIKEAVKIDIKDL